MAPPTKARIQFLCEKRQINWTHDIPSSLIGPASLSNPAMPEMFSLVMRPIVMEHAKDALDACEPKCSSKGCERDATTIVATPMSVSYLRPRSYDDNNRHQKANSSLRASD